MIDAAELEVSRIPRVVYFSRTIRIEPPAIPHRRRRPSAQVPSGKCTIKLVQPFSIAPFEVGIKVSLFKVHEFLDNRETNLRVIAEVVSQPGGRCFLRSDHIEIGISWGSGASC